MANHTVRFRVDCKINAGKLDAFQSIGEAMIAGTQKEPGALEYEWFLSGDRTRCQLLESYANPDAVLAHLTGPVVQELVPKLLETSSISSFDVFGDPGPKAAEILAGLGAEIFQFWRGLTPD
jgi:quinol monooxygenase YgiN